MFTMCTHDQVIDLLLQGFEKEWNTASPKRSFFKFKNLRVLVSFLIFFLWTACSSCKVFYRYDEVWCVFFWNSLRWNNTVTADETWLASFDTKPFIYLPTLSIAGFSHHRDHYVTVPYFTNSKAAAFTSHKNQDLLICGVSKQLAWLSHMFTCTWDSGLDRLPNSWLLEARSCQAGHLAHRSNGTVYPATEPRLLTSYKQTLRTVKELWDGAYNWFLLYSRMSNHRM